MNLKPFDLEAAKNGAKVVTREGLPVKILKFDLKSEYPIVAVVRSSDTRETIQHFLNSGAYHISGVCSPLDLFLKETEPKIEIWYGYIFVGNDGQTLRSRVIYKSREEAENKGKEIHLKYIGTYKTEVEI